MFSPFLDALFAIIIISVCVLGPCWVIASVGHAAIQALGRNPSAAPRILMPMLLAFIFAEALGLVALLVAFQLFT